MVTAVVTIPTGYNGFQGESSRIFFFCPGGWGCCQTSSVKNSMQPEDCDLLHAGLDEMRKNTNPFTGGINFDESWLARAAPRAFTCRIKKHMKRSFVL